MSKRDTIIAAVLVNLIVLAVLFMFARNTSEDQSKGQSEISYTLEDVTALPTAQPVPVEISATPSILVQAGPRDEVDDVLNSYSASPVEAPVQSQPDITQAFVNESQGGREIQEIKEESSSKNNIIEVTVKKGDALEKIARAYGTTVDEIKRLNHLTSEKLNIGQVLKVQANKTPPATTPKTASASKTSTVAAATPASTSSGPVYYTIKSGDNPWKIARQYKVRYEDILKLNNLNEEKARNLKVGDKIRVK